MSQTPKNSQIGQLANEKLVLGVLKSVTLCDLVCDKDSMYIQMMAEDTVWAPTCFIERLTGGGIKNTFIAQLKDYPACCALAWYMKISKFSTPGQFSSNTRRYIVIHANSNTSGHGYV
jgi:hypothetical protein